MTDRQLEDAERDCKAADFDGDALAADIESREDADDSRDPIEVIADQFVERCRRGENPSIEAYVSQHPEHADEIRDLFPTIVAMERLKATKEKHSSERVLSVSHALERLGDLRIIGEIGRGGMGIVYEAEQESLGRRVAVKVLPKQFLLDEKRLLRFRREARTAANLHHTNIVPILGVGEHDGYHYYVMQYIRGVGLDEVVARIADRGAPDGAANASSGRAGEVTRVAQALLSGKFEPHRSPSSATGTTSAVITSQTDAELAAQHGPGTRPATPSSDECSAITIAREELDARDTTPVASATTAPDDIAPKPRLGTRYWRSVAQVGFQAADALHYAHEQNVLHRDIKPANLLLDSHGVVWIADFGLAKAMEQDDVTRSGDIVGTLRYMAPEQALGETDTRSDIYSLGLTLYELLTLRLPYDDAVRKQALLSRSPLSDPERLRRLDPNIPRDLETIVLKAMALEPDNRYQSAEEMAADLSCFLDDRPILARRVSPVERLWRWCRRNPAVSSLAGTALALLVLVAALASIGYVQAREANRLIQRAFDGERTQRERAEATLDISLEALDRIATRFMPDQLAAGTPLTIEVDDGEQFELSAQPAVSKETAALLEDLLPFYDRLAEQYGQSERLRLEVAKAYRRVGDIQQRLGNPTDAASAYQRAIAKYRELAASGDDDRFLPAAARICNDLGNVHLAMLDFGQARASYEEALSLIRSVPEPLSQTAEVRYELAHTYYHLGQRGGIGPGKRPPGGARGERREQPDSTRSRDGQRPPHFRFGFRPSGQGDARRSGRSENLDRAIQILLELTAEHPNAPDYRRLLALCYREGAWSSRPKDLAKAIAMLEEICREVPNHIGYRLDLCDTLAMLDPRSPDLTLEDLDVVEDRLTRALQIANRLGVEYPNEPTYLASQVHVHHKLAFALAHRARLDVATDDGVALALSEQHHRRAIALQAFLVDNFPDVTAHAVWLAILRGSFARSLASRQQFDEAYMLLEASAADLNERLRDDTEQRSIRGSLMFCYWGQLMILTQMGRDDDALEVMERIKELRGNMPWPKPPSGRPPESPPSGEPDEGSEKQEVREPRQDAKPVPS